MTERALLAIAEAIQALADAISAPKERSKRTRSERMPVPEDLSLEDKRALKAWAQHKEPWAVPKLRELVDDCLQWHRAEGKTRASYYIACQRWITNARAKYGEDKAVKQETRPALPEHHVKTEAELRAEIEASGDRVLDREEAQARIFSMIGSTLRRKQG